VELPQQKVGVWKRNEVVDSPEKWKTKAQENLKNGSNIVVELWKKRKKQTTTKRTKKNKKEQKRTKILLSAQQSAAEKKNKRTKLTTRSSRLKVDPS
jgi:hypothetical protein